MFSTVYLSFLLFRIVDVARGFHSGNRFCYALRATAPTRGSVALLILQQSRRWVPAPFCHCGRFFLFVRSGGPFLIYFISEVPVIPMISDPSTIQILIKVSRFSVVSPRLSNSSDFHDSDLFYLGPLYDFHVVYVLVKRLSMSMILMTSCDHL